MPSGLVPVWIRLYSSTTGAPFAHPDMRRLLIEEAERQGTNMTSVVVQILAERYKVPVDQSFRRAQADLASDYQIKPQLPSKLYARINAAAAAHADPSWNRQREILATLHAHLGLELPPPPARGRGVHAAA